MDTITCPRCGSENSSSAMNCRQCKINLQYALEQYALEHPEENAASKEDQEVHVYEEKRYGCATKLGAAVVLIIGIAIFVSLIYSWASEIKLNLANATAQATILNRHINYDEDGDPAFYWVTYQFTPIVPDGKAEPIEVEETVSSRLYRRLSPGSLWTVRYLPSNPRRARIGSYWTSSGRADIYFLGLSVVCLAIALAVFWPRKASKPKRIRKTTSRPQPSTHSREELREFLEELRKIGFEQSTRSDRLFYHPAYPERRLVITKQIIRLERRNREEKGRTWRLDESYSIKRELELALGYIKRLFSLSPKSEDSIPTAT